jgi:hypothetical protein
MKLRRLRPLLLRIHWRIPSLQPDCPDLPDFRLIATKGELGEAHFVAVALAGGGSQVSVIVHSMDLMRWLYSLFEVCWLGSMCRCELAIFMFIIYSDE